MSITVHTLPHCPHCVKVKRYLDAHKVTYAITDLTEDDAARDKVKRAGFKQAPVIEADGFAPHSGFRPKILDAIIEQEQ